MHEHARRKLRLMDFAPIPNLRVESEEGEWPLEGTKRSGMRIFKVYSC
jgi:hypothetical protein